MGTQLGAQCRARLLLGCRDVQEQVPGAAAKSLGRGQLGKPPLALTPPAPDLAACSQHQPRSDPTRPAGAGSWIQRHLRHRAGQRPLQCKYLLSAAHLTTFPFYFLSKAPFVLQVLPALVLPDTPWALAHFGCQSCPLVNTGQSEWLQELEQ